MGKNINKKVEKIVIAVISGVIVAAIVSLIPPTCSKNLDITIIDPNDGEYVGNTERITDEEQMIIDLQIEIKGDLKDNRIICFLRVAGGNKYWISGNVLTENDINENGIGSIGYVTIGTTNDGNMAYQITTAIMGKDFTIISGTNYSELPDNIIDSDSIIIHKNYY